MAQIASGSEVLRSKLDALPVGRKQRTNRIELLPALGIGALLLFGALFYVWQHIQVVRLGYEIEQLKTERAALVQREKELMLKIARLKSPKRVEEIARQKLGLVAPAPSQIIVIHQREDLRHLGSWPFGERGSTR